MRLVTFDAGAGARAGAVLEDVVADLNVASVGRLPARVIDLLAQDGGLEQACELAGSPGAFKGEGVHRLADVRLLAPIPRPGRVAALGMNYIDHAAEGGADVPSEPVIFSKAPTSVIGPGEAIVLPEASKKVDYEAELAFVIGRRCKLAPAQEAMDYVAGYTVVHDVSARDYQLEKPCGQWHLGKSFDTFCPMGPWIVTADEIPDPHDLAVSCEVSGEVLQSSTTSAMVFRIPVIIEYLTRVFTLEPGDVVATGTPHGVGMARTPPRWLRSGDVVRCTVEGVGTLENPVR